MNKFLILLALFKSSSLFSQNFFFDYSLGVRDLGFYDSFHGAGDGGSHTSMRVSTFFGGFQLFDTPVIIGYQGKLLDNFKDSLLECYEDGLRVKVLFPGSFLGLPESVKPSFHVVPFLSSSFDEAYLSDSTLSYKGKGSALGLGFSYALSSRVDVIFDYHYSYQRMSDVEVSVKDTDEDTAKAKKKQIQTDVNEKNHNPSINSHEVTLGISFKF